MNPRNDKEHATPKMLRDFRQEFNLTQKNLHELLEVTWQTVSRWERGLQPIRHPKLLYLALQTVRGRLVHKRRPRPRASA